MDNLFLAQLKELSEDDIKKHISDEYAGDESGYDYGCPNDAEKAKITKILKGYDIKIAYEHVGSWGCDSSSYFLLQEKSTKKYFEISGGHNSCYGFEGQFDLQEATIEYLNSDKFYFCAGGYDDNETENEKLIKQYMKALKD